MTQPPAMFGLLAEFTTPDELLHAAEKSYEAGYRRLDAYTPYPIEGLAEAIGFHKSILPFLVLLGGILGCVGGFTLQYYASVVDYPLNIGGKPYASWPSFVVVAFEMTILSAALFAVLGMLALNGLPQPYHPVFNVERFELASRNRFFLCILARDPMFEVEETRSFLEDLKALSVNDVDY